jgi:hypothetical protein
MKQRTGFPAVDMLSPAAQTALKCRNTGGLYKQNGFWHGSSTGKIINGNTVANLGREGLMSVTTNGKSGSARLTECGERFAGKLFDAATKWSNEAEHARADKVIE